MGSSSPYCFKFWGWKSARLSKDKPVTSVRNADRYASSVTSTSPVKYQWYSTSGSVASAELLALASALESPVSSDSTSTPRISSLLVSFPSSITDWRLLLDRVGNCAKEAQA